MQLIGYGLADKITQRSNSSASGRSRQELILHRAACSKGRDCKTLEEPAQIRFTVFPCFIPFLFGRGDKDCGAVTPASALWEHRVVGVGLVDVLSPLQVPPQGDPWAARPSGCGAALGAAAVPPLLPRRPEEEEFSVTLGALTELLQHFFPGEQEVGGPPTTIPMPLSRWKPWSCLFAASFNSFPHLE